MSYTEIFVLALVQALTEFLPVSSSAHLYLASHFFPGGYQGLAFDLVLHLGTLAAVLVYFRQDWLKLIGGTFAYRGGALDDSQRTMVGIVLASIPAGLLGLLMSKTGMTEVLRNDILIAINLIVFGILLYVAERVSQGRDQALSIKQMLLIGVAQMLALVPGVSRSGITMTAGLFLGLKREDAARFSFLLAVPATSMAVAKGLWDLAQSGDEHISLLQFVVGALLSFGFGLAVIHLFLGLIRKIGVLPFTIYRLCLGLAVLLWVALR